MPAGKKPRHIQETPSPIEMLIWQESLDNGAEGHAFWTSVRSERSRLDWQKQSVQSVAGRDRISPELSFGGFKVTVSLPPTVQKRQ